jgi:hypothetical protein
MSESGIDDLNYKQILDATVGDEGPAHGKTKTLAARWPHVYAQGFGRDVAPGRRAWVRPKAARREPSGATAFLALRV